MQLLDIDKKVYRKHLNICIAIGIVALAALSLAISTTTIALFTDGTGTHFYHNLIGVGVSVVILLVVFNILKPHPFLKEVVYVLDLKHQLNLIYRKSRKINAALKQDDITAIKIMYFNYRAMIQLYTLDDNTITLSEINVQKDALDAQISELGYEVSLEDFNKSLLEEF